MDKEFQYEEGYRRNSRGVRLFTCKWLPLLSPKALVFLCHGYGMECSRYMRGYRYDNSVILGVAKKNALALKMPLPFAIIESGVRLASAGYAVFGLDYEGHGRSEGSRCYIRKFDGLVNDCYDFFKSVTELKEYKGKGRFLYGESMGGAVALLLHKKDPHFWDGAVLVAPMCKISESVKPHPVVISILTKVEDVIPAWKIVPTKDVIDSAFKDPAKRETIRRNGLIYQDKPRLKTALEMLRASMNLEESLEVVTLPFFVLHGEADTVTDPEVSRALYERASSKDKTIKLYPDMWHGLTAGEPDENIHTVFTDIIDWLDKRAPFALQDRTTLDPVDDQSPAIDYGVEKLTTAASLLPVDETQRLRKTRSRPSYFCGLKGRRLLHHSSM